MTGKKITHNENNFCQNIADGMLQNEAYRKAFKSPNATEGSLNTMASRLAKQDRIKKRIADLQEKRNLSTLWNAERSAKVKLEAIRIAQKNADASGMIRGAESLDKQFGVTVDTLNLVSTDGSVSAPVLISITKPDDSETD